MAPPANQPPRIACPTCGAPLKIVAFEPGERLTCPKCNTPFQAPAASGSAAKPVSSLPNADDDLFALDAPSFSPPPSPTGRPSSPASPPPFIPPTRMKPGDEPLPRLSVPAPETIPFDENDEAPLVPITTGFTPPRQPSQPAPALPTAKRTDGFEFSVPCPLCATQLDFTNQAIGTKFACPDCTTSFTVPEPKPSQIRHRRETEEGSFTLADAVERNVQAIIPGAEVVRHQADSMLAKAAKELADEEKKERRELGDRDLSQVFKFLLMPTTITRWVMLALLAMVVLGLIGAIIAQWNAAGGIMAMLLSLPTILIGALWFLALCACLMAILRDAGNGSGGEIDWPEFSPMDWAGAAFYVANAMLYTFIPAGLMTFLFGAAASPNVAAFGFVVLSTLGIVFIFPIIMLSTTHEESLFAPFSGHVLRSLTVARQYWVTFFQAAFVLGFFGSLAISMSVGSIGVTSAIIVGPLLVTILFIYFRFLGWLAWRSGELMAELDEEEET